jgi:hypothetical protein
LSVTLEYYSQIVEEFPITYLESLYEKPAAELTKDKRNLTIRSIEGEVLVTKKYNVYDLIYQLWCSGSVDIIDKYDGWNREFEDIVLRNQDIHNYFGI